MNPFTSHSVTRRRLITGMAALAAPALLRAQEAFPAKPIRLLVGISPGGAVDAIARLYAKHVSEQLGVAVIVENRPGAFQVQAIRGVTSAPPDGHTLFLTNGSAVSLSPAVEKNLPYDPETDFTYISRIASTSAVFVVSNSLPVKNVQELIAYSKAHPDQINYGSAGAGTANNIKIEYIKELTGLKATHIPFKSDTDVLREIVAGRVHFSITTLLGAMPFLTSDKVRAIGVTSAQPHKNLPGVPGTEQVGIKGLERLEPYSFFGFVGPAGLPPHIVAKLNKVINEVSVQQDVQKTITGTYHMDVVRESPQRFREHVVAELQKSRELAKLIQSS